MVQTWGCSREWRKPGGCLEGGKRTANHATNSCSPLCSARSLLILLSLALLCSTSSAREFFAIHSPIPLDPLARPRVHVVLSTLPGVH